MKKPENDPKAKHQRKSQKPKQHRVLLVDDHPMIRERLAEAFAREPGLEVCGEAEDARTALKAVSQTSPDLVIVDLSLKDSHGIDLIKDLHALNPDLAILVVSMHDESLHAERVIGAGARGYITKQEATKKILTAVRTVLEGGIYLSQEAALRVASKSAGPNVQPALPIDKLTDRELRVLELIGQGFGTRQIAELLKLSMATIETYRARTKEKLGLKDASGLLQYAIRLAQAGPRARK
ncbi:MAG TPA: response regulator transcription factor [Candidatus Dormibacteraeota bacterium]|nr:response regulator transcription factor [Candidatus Dormibacteraeota bacterium]